MLRIFVLVEEEDRDLQPAVFERLSKLVQLKELMVDVGSLKPFNEENLLEFLLDQGMRQLASLQQLIRLTFSGHIRYPDSPYFPQLEIQEVEWMMETWKNLKFINGDLNSNREVNAELKRIIESRGLNKEP